MYESDKNMLAAIDKLKATGVIKFYKEVQDLLGWGDKNRLQRIRTQRHPDQGHHFSADDIRILCQHYHLNANEILGIKAVTKPVTL